MRLDRRGDRGSLAHRKFFAWPAKPDTGLIVGTLDFVRVDLFDSQKLEDRVQGKLTGADGRAYSRRGTRMSRRAADDLVATGVPVVLELYGHGRFEWADGEDARQVWHEVRPYVITSEPTTKQLRKHEMWNAGVWTSDDDCQLLYLTGTC